MTQILLCDNGSRQPAATLMLRQIARQLSALAQRPVEPVSLQHAMSIDAELLEGLPAQTLVDYLSQQLQVGERDFIILPLLFGKSRALTSFVPEQQQELQQQFGEFRVRIAEVLYPLPEGDATLVQVLYSNIQQCLATTSASHVVLVDHGSPVPSVTAVRQHIAEQLAPLLGDQVTLSEAVMERRAGPEYDFNGDLLKDWLTEKATQGVKTVIVSMMFLLPGKHAGAGGDVNEICADVMQSFPGFEVLISPLVGESVLLPALLNERLQRIAG